ncbi:MAG: helix-turn-helix domain-containing protein [Pirellulales bacterium]|nr:helix-turn-helix domain-containing protein [Pirellulales bacterium]
MQPPSHESVTDWIARIKQGDQSAAQQLWKRYIEQLIAQVRYRVPGVAGRMADENDAVQSAFRSFFRRAQSGQFAALNDRRDLWQLLVVMAARKAKNMSRRERAKKRGGGRIRTAPRLADGESGSGDLQWLAAPTPSPEFAAIIAEEFERLLTLLADEPLRRLALLKFEGFGHEEIAERLGCSVRTVTRRLDLIRKSWEQGATGSRTKLPASHRRGRSPY